jgi:hypothetical protein
LKISGCDSSEALLVLRFIAGFSPISTLLVLLLRYNEISIDSLDFLGHVCFLAIPRHAMLWRASGCGGRFARRTIAPFPPFIVAWRNCSVARQLWRWQPVVGNQTCP